MGAIKYAQHRKDARSILKKFEVPGEYETRKIVFWYDKGETADDGELETIKSALARDGTKLHILNNNFFATKKLLETQVSHPKIKTTSVGLYASKISAVSWS